MMLVFNLNFKEEIVKSWLVCKKDRIIVSEPCLYLKPYKKYRSCDFIRKWSCGIIRKRTSPYRFPTGPAPRQRRFNITGNTILFSTVPALICAPLIILLLDLSNPIIEILAEVIDVVAPVCASCVGVVGVVGEVGERLAVSLWAARSGGESAVVGGFGR
jgi:hypothetical protein